MVAGDGAGAAQHNSVEHGHTSMTSSGAMRSANSLASAGKCGKRTARTCESSMRPKKANMAIWGMPAQ